jgi:DNA-binding NarL/FixJ family response regulator
MSNAEIASELVLGENTVKTHVACVLGKLGCATASKPWCSPTKQDSCRGPPTELSAQRSDRDMRIARPAPGLVG